MPTTARHFVYVFRACNAISPLLALLFCGCAVLFGEKHSLVTTVQAQSSSPARFKAILAMSTRYVEFNGFQVHPDKQRLRITVINRGRSAFVIKHGDQNYAPVTPGIPIEIYSAELPNSTNSLRFPLSGIQNRTPCEFQVEVSNPTQFRDAIKVYVVNSSAPM